jgi:integrase
VLTLDQLYALVDLMPDRWTVFVLLKTFASLRWGEITALTRNDLDLARRTVRIRQQLLTMPGGLQLGPPKSRAGLRMVSFPPAILRELQHHLDTYSLDGPDGLVFVSEHRQPWHRGNFNPALRWRHARADRIAQPPSSTTTATRENTLAAQPGASLGDLMTRMGQDSPAAVLIYQHSGRVADEAIAAALDVRLTERKSRPAPTSWGPWRARPSSSQSRLSRIVRENGV